MVIGEAKETTMSVWDAHGESTAAAVFGFLSQRDQSWVISSTLICLCLPSAWLLWEDQSGGIYTMSSDKTLKP